jgi:hypothetical protein
MTDVTSKYNVLVASMVFSLHRWEIPGKKGKRLINNLVKKSEYILHSYSLCLHHNVKTKFQVAK